MGAARTASQSPDPKFKEGLENVTKMPEGSERSMSFMGLMADSIGGGIMGRTGRATMTGDVGAGPFKKFTDKEEQDKEETREVTSSQSSDFDMDKVRERLLSKAKEERAARSQQYTKEKQVYNQSLPDSAKQMQMFVGGDMADKDEFMKRTGLTPVGEVQNKGGGTWSAKVRTK